MSATSSVATGTPGGTAGSLGAPRSLAEELRRRSDEEIATLLRLRPDLLQPVPGDLASLAARATTSASTGRALDALDEWTLKIAEAVSALPLSGLADAGSVGIAELLEAVPETAAALAAIDRLIDLGLLWRMGDDGLYLTRAVRDLLGDYPCGLAATGGWRTERYEGKANAELLSGAPAEALELLGRLAWGPPIGRIANADRVVTRESARTPIEWLLARDLLIAEDAETVLLPRSVALHLRGGQLLRDVSAAPPELATLPTRSAELVERTGGSSAATIVRHVADLLEAWATEPPDRLRTGGLGIRSTTAASAALNLPTSTAALVMELAAAAGLLADDGEVWLPTTAYDGWLTWTTAQQWALLARTWLATTRVPSMVGTRNPTLINALTADAARSWAPAVRRSVLELISTLPATTQVEPGSMIRRLDWQSPRRRGEARTTLALAVLAEAEVLGITGLGAITTAGRLLIQEAPRLAREGGPDELANAVNKQLPEPVSKVLLQADLTAVAPGPLELDIARRIRVIADPESTGGATVYRFSEATIRRGLDAGMSQHDIVEFLREVSATGLPQPLEYLVGDVARRHGGIRVGLATAYIRSDDESTLSAICLDRNTAAIGPIRLAPTVVAVTAALDTVLATLRAAGYAPMAEAPDGRIVVRNKQSRRAPSMSASLEAPRPPANPTYLLAQTAVRALRAGDRAGGGTGDESRPRSAESRVARSTTSQVMAFLREAVEHEAAIRIGYADTHGTASERIVDPLQLISGVLTAYDHRAGEVRTFAVSRVTGVELIEEPTGE